MVAGVGRGLFAELDGLERTPLDAGQALLAAALPYGFSGAQQDIAAGADGSADGAGIALIVRPEILVHLGHL